jgi:hypothetical protein
MPTNIETNVVINTGQAVKGIQELTTASKQFQTEVGQIKQASDNAFKPDKITTYRQQLRELQSELKGQEQVIKETKEAMNQLGNTTSKHYQTLKQDLNSANQQQQQIKKEIQQTTQEIKKMESAQKDVHSTGDRLTSMFTKLGGIIATAFAAQQILNFTKEMIKAGLELEQTEAKLQFGLKGREVIYKRLIDFADEMSKKTIISKEQIIAMESFLSAQGLTEKQIRKTIQAATELSAVAPNMSFDTALQAIARTFETGIVDRGMAKFIGRHKELTSEQIKNGAIVDIIIKKYDGFAETLGNTAAGKAEIAKNQIAALKAEIGKNLVDGLKNAGKAFDEEGSKIEKGLERMFGVSKYLEYKKTIDLITNYTFQTIADAKYKALYKSGELYANGLLAQGLSTDEIKKRTDTFLKSVKVANDTERDIISAGISERLLLYQQEQENKEPKKTKIVKESKLSVAQQYGIDFVKDYVEQYNKVIDANEKLTKEQQSLFEEQVKQEQAYGINFVEEWVKQQNAIADANDKATKRILENHLKVIRGYGDLFGAVSDFTGNLASLSKENTDLYRTLALVQILTSGAQALAGGLAAVSSDTTNNTLAGKIAGYISIAASIIGVMSQVYSMYNSAPGYAEGVIDIKGGHKGKDSIPSMLMPGESVMTTTETEQNKGLLTAIRQGKRDEYIRTNFTNQLNIEKISQLISKNDDSFAEKVAKSIQLNFPDLFDVKGIYELRQKTNTTNELLQVIVQNTKNKQKRIR